MKTLTIMLFGLSLGVLSHFFGLDPLQEPMKYFLINAPLIACFTCLVNLLPEKEKPGVK